MLIKIGLQRIGEVESCIGQLCELLLGAGGDVVQIRFGAERRHAPLAQRDIRKRLRGARELKQHAAEHQLHDQHKRHHRHGGGGRAGDGRNHESEHRRAERQQIDGDKIFDVGADQQMRRLVKMHKNTADNEYDDRLRQTEHHLPQHVRTDVGRHLHALAVLGADDLVLLANALYRIENAYPNAGGRKREKAGIGGFKGFEHVLTDDQRDDHRDDGGKNKVFPCFFTQRNAKQLFGIDMGLGDKGGVVHFAPPASRNF